jgi:hypothetical protein
VLYISRGNRGSSVGIATGYGLGGQGTIPGRDKEIFLYSAASRLALGPSQSPIQWALGALSPGVKRPGREADHSPPYSAEVFFLVGWDVRHQVLRPLLAYCTAPNDR